MSAPIAQQGGSFYGATGYDDDAIFSGVDDALADISREDLF